jgi:hypothetical protein
MVDTGDTRVWQLPLAIRVVVPLLALAILIDGGSLVFDRDPRGLLALVMAPVFLWLAGWRSLVRVEPEGLTIRNGLRTYRLRWSDVHRAEIARAGVLVHAHDGHRRLRIVASAGQGIVDPTIFKRAGRTNRELVEATNSRAKG